MTTRELYFEGVPEASTQGIFNQACRFGNAEVVKVMLEHLQVDPSDLDNWPIQLASEHNHVEVVKLLLDDKRVDPTACANGAIRVASYFKHTKVVKLLKDYYVKHGLTIPRCVL